MLSGEQRCEPLTRAICYAAINDGAPALSEKQTPETVCQNILPTGIALRGPSAIFGKRHKKASGKVGG